MSQQIPKASRGIASINPATGEMLRRFEPDSPGELQRKLALAEETFRSYRKSPLAQRAHFLDRAADLLEQGKEGFARTMTLEMGKPAPRSRKSRNAPRRAGTTPGMERAF